MALNKKTQKIGMAVGDVKAGGTIHKYRLVKLSAYNTIVETTSAAVAVGVVLEDYAEGDTATYYSHSIVPVECSAAIAIGAKVSADSNGKAATTTSTNFVVGICVEATAAAGDLAMVQLLV